MKRVLNIIKHILHSLFINTTAIISYQLNKVQQHFFAIDDKWIDLELLNVMCPNLREIIPHQKTH